VGLIGRLIGVFVHEGCLRERGTGFSFWFKTNRPAGEGSGVQAA
jgi:hypothetical protein